MNIFQDIKTKIENDSFYILRKNEFFKCYSLKSFSRENRILMEKITKSAEKRRKLIWIAPFHEEILNNIPKELIDRLIWISPVSFTNPVKNANVIIDDKSLKFFLLGIEKKDAFEIHCHNCFSDFNLTSEISVLIKSSAARIKTLEHFGNVWQNNFIHNKNTWLTCQDISTFKNKPPDLLILGGPSVDKITASVKDYQNIWCCDTALPTLIQYNMIPTAVFSVDAGYASYEHFITAIDHRKTLKITLILDPLSFPALFKLNFLKIFTYANSNPSIQNADHHFTILENSTNDIFGLMIAVFDLLYHEPYPQIIGHDGGHIRKVTHLRGSAYHRIQYTKCNRFITPEQYFLRLSKRYSRNSSIIADKPV